MGTRPYSCGTQAAGAMTYGALANHIWSVAGDDDRSDVSATFLNPFVTYTTKNAVSFTGMTESTYDWESEQWSVPLIVMVTKVTKIGGQLVSMGGGLRYYVDSTDGGPEGWGARIVFTLLFPK